MTDSQPDAGADPEGAPGLDPQEPDGRAVRRHGGGGGLKGLRHALMVDRGIADREFDVYVGTSVGS